MGKVEKLALVLRRGPDEAAGPGPAEVAVAADGDGKEEPALAAVLFDVGVVLSGACGLGLELELDVGGMSTVGLRMPLSQPRFSSLCACVLRRAVLFAPTWPSSTVRGNVLTVLTVRTKCALLPLAPTSAIGSALSSALRALGNSHRGSGAKARRT